MGSLIIPLSFLWSSLLGLGAPSPGAPKSCSGQRCMAERRRVFKQNVSGSSFSSTLFFLLSAISLVWLSGRICNRSIMVVWAFLFCVTTDA